MISENLKRITRRQLLKSMGTVGVAATFPTIIPASVFGADAPSNRVTLGVIGAGDSRMRC